MTSIDQTRPFARAPLASALAAALFAAGLAGCASYGDLEALKEQPSYQSGYVDGCYTATEEDKSFSTKKKRDEDAFAEDDAYRAGWRHGYLECAPQTPDANDGGRITGERNEY
ncbi:MAG: hypothetical protein R3C58_09010 [Parvularculaceae bacterium]